MVSLLGVILFPRTMPLPHFLLSFSTLLHLPPSPSIPLHLLCPQPFSFPSSSTKSFPPSILPPPHAVYLIYTLTHPDDRNRCTINYALKYISSVLRLLPANASLHYTAPSNHQLSCWRSFHSFTLTFFSFSPSSYSIWQLRTTLYYIFRPAMLRLQLNCLIISRYQSAFAWSCFTISLF